MDTNAKTSSSPIPALSSRGPSSTQLHAGDLIGRALSTVGRSLVCAGAGAGAPRAWLEVRGSQAVHVTRQDVVRGLTEIEAFLDHQHDGHPDN